MPRHPERLFAEYKGEKYQTPYKMNAAEEERYNRYEFARRKYIELIGYLNSTTRGTNPKTDEWLGFGGENGVQKPMDEKISELLKDRCGELINASNQFMDITKKSIEDVQKNAAERRKLEEEEKKESEERIRKEEEEWKAEELRRKEEEEKKKAEGNPTIQDIAQLENEKLERERLEQERLERVKLEQERLEKMRLESEKLEKEEHVYMKNRGKLIFDLRANRKRAINDVSHLESIDPENMPSYLAMHRQSTEVTIDTTDMKVETAGDVLSTRYKLRYMDENGKVKQGYFTVDVNEEKYNEKTKEKIVRNINQRNVAMSDIATLLGMGKMLAKSTEMTMINNGKAYHGCFMENANGIDFHDLTPNNPLLMGKSLGINYDKTVRSATDLMVLDYICLNRDRHEKNHFYQVETNENGQLEVVGFQGIDNDASFGAFIPKNNENYGYLPPLNNILCMHKDTADAIMNLDLDMVSVNLSDHDMDPLAITACIKRIEKIQEKISRNEIAIKEQFDATDFEMFDAQVNMDKPAETGINPINNLSSVALRHYDRKCDNYRKVISNERSKRLNALDPKGTMTKQEKRDAIIGINRELYQKQQKSIEYQSKQKFLESGIKDLHNKVQMDQIMNVTVQCQKVHKLFNKLWSPKGKDIPEYGKMYESMQELDKKLTQYSKLSKKDPLNDMQQNKLAELYSEVEKNIKEYVSEISIGPTKNDMKRISISSAIQEICVIGKEQRERSVNEMNELMTNAVNSLTEAAKNLEAKTAKHKNEPKHPEIYLAEKEMKAKSNLAAYVGTLTNPKGTYMDTVKHDIATIIVAEKFRRLEKANPEAYEKQIQKLGTKGNTINDITTKLLKDWRFENIVSNVRPGQALTHKAQNYILDMVDKTDKAKSFVADYQNGEFNQKTTTNGPAV